MSKNAEQIRSDTIWAYIEKFNEGPPLIGLSEEEALAQMQAAIKTGKPMPGVDMSEFPDGALI